MNTALPDDVITDGPIRVAERHPRQSRADDLQLLNASRIARSGMPTKTGIVRRPRGRLCMETLCTWNGKRRYHRVPGTALVFDAESPEQLQLVWETIVELLRSLDGKYLVPPPDPSPAIEPE